MRSITIKTRNQHRTAAEPPAHRARKRFGQNFLHSESVIHSILAALNPQANDTVIEIGPGLGALTQPLLKRLSKLIAIEIDRDLQAHLRGLSTPDHLEIINADALTVDYSQWGRAIRLIGNLPYNISTPLLFHLLNFAPTIEDMYFMLQKEVAERLAAEPGSKDYGRLTIMVQYQCSVSILFDVPPESFSPAPKVNSAVVCLKPYRVSPYAPVEQAVLREVVTRAFSMRRKTLANNFRGLLTAEELSAIELNPTARPEQISLEEYVRLANFLRESGKV